MAKISRMHDLRLLRYMCSKIKEENYVFLTYFLENAYYYNAVYIIG